MNKPLILIGLDRTLIDKKYDLDFSCGIIQKLEQMQNDGWLIGLNSDTPIPRLAQIARNVGISGPLVTELGNAVFLNSGYTHSVPYWNTPGIQPIFKTLRTIVGQHFMETNPEASVIFGNSLALKNHVLKNYFDYSNQVLIIDSIRQYSFNCFLIRITQGDYQYDIEELKKLGDFITTVARDAFDGKQALIDVDDRYGICIAHAPGSAKRNALPALINLPRIKKSGPKQQIFMIGDSIDDHLHDRRVIHFGVSNATDEYKRKCFYVADQEYTRGVLQCLEKIQTMF